MRLTVLSVVVAALAVPVPSTYAAAGTCEGVPATIHSADLTVTGTEGDDVIVSTHPHAQVFALGGSDRVCFAGGLVDAGDGNDAVFSTASAGQLVETVLGEGDDSYQGGPASDIVDYHENEPASEGTSPGKDHIVTYQGTDYVGSGGLGEPNLDKIYLGPSQDILRIVAPAGSYVTADGGRDTTVLILKTDISGDIRVDLRSPKVKLADQGSIDLRGDFSSSDVDAPQSHVIVQGTPEGEEVHVRGRRVDLNLRGGDDVAEVLPTPDDQVGDLRLGPGRDLVRWYSRTKVVVRQPSFGRADGRHDRYNTYGVENVDATAKRVRIVGDGQRNEIRVVACSATIKGGGGDDLVELNGGPGGPDSGPVSYGRCKPYGPFRLFGQTGDDILYGFKGNDVLLGGPGRDIALGLRGTDRCVAEVEKSCER
jgi:Ca2+-binding RTX toxin-like protein